jgi:hypothetical protein
MDEAFCARMRAAIAAVALWDLGDKEHLGTNTKPQWLITLLSARQIRKKFRAMPALVSASLGMNLLAEDKSKGKTR